MTKNLPEGEVMSSIRNSYVTSNVVKARVRAWVSPCAICSGQSGTGTGFPPRYSVSPVNIIPPWLSMFICNLGDEHYACYWPQFRDSLIPLT
jgi:hypothetical protein